MRATRADANPGREAAETLDPADWPAPPPRARIVDDAVDHVSRVRERPVCAPMPTRSKPCSARRFPRTDPDRAVYGLVKDNVLAYPMGNIHTRFWSWYMGAGNFTGALGDFLAAVQGSNLGGGSHAAALVDQQVVGWLRDMIGLPATASGTLVSGGSMANLIGLTVARNAMAGIDLREEGVGALEKPMRFYASDQVHSCHRKAVETLGLGNSALRRIPTDAACRMDFAALREAIARDRESGFRPACVIGTAGTVNSGAIDDLDALADLAGEEDMWFHVDGSSAPCLPSRRGTPGGCGASNGRIPWPSTRTNGCMPRSRSAAPSFAIAASIARPSPSHPNISRARRAASPRANGCTNSGSRPAAASVR